MFFKKTKIKKNTNINQTGFTLIEMVIVMGIITFLSATMFQVVSVSETNRGLIMAGDKVKSSIRLAQSYALAVPQEATQRVVCGYGIHTDGTSIIKIYHLYNNNFEANPEACNNSVDLDYTPGASLTKVDDNAINLGTNYKATSSKIFLKTPYGEVYSNNTKLTGVSIGYIKIDKDGNISDIEINGGGQINF